MILGQFGALVSGSCVRLLADCCEGLFVVRIVGSGLVIVAVIVFIIVIRELFHEVFIRNKSIFGVNVKVFTVETKVLIP